MIKASTFFLLFATFVSFKLVAQETQGFSSITRLTRLPITKSTGEKPQSKVWSYACKQWAVLPDTRGTHLWRLDSTKWTQVLTISPSTTTKADCKVVGSTVHVLLFDELVPIHDNEDSPRDTTGLTDSKAYLVSLEYNHSSDSYKRWAKRESTITIPLDKGAETASIDIDGSGRMWLASDGVNRVNVRWSDAPFSEWSSPITLAKGLKDDDICGVVALPGKIGVFWSNQNTRKFGFRTHTDGAAPTAWSVDEVPASQSSSNIGKGMADDHMNFAVAKDGTLYCAVKTSFDTPGHPLIALLVRRPTGSWDNLYEVSGFGTRPIALLDETKNSLKIVFSAVEDGGDILYKETPASKISFGPQLTLISGKFDDATSSKDNFSSDVVILASNKTHAVGVLAGNGSNTEVCPDKEASLTSITAYPNPFSEKTTIYFSLPEGGEYELTLYDSKGAKVADLKKGTTAAGELNAFSLHAFRKARGMYLVKLQHGEKIKSVKLVLER